jgi:osmotically-inducible protein OsmY
MRSDQDLQKDVQDALQWELLLNAAQIGVTVDNGIVTLTGTVDSYAKKLVAEEATKNVTGVKAVVEKIEIKFYSSLGTCDDNEIAAEVVNAFKWNKDIPGDKVRVKVEDGWVTLEGELPWNFQREAIRKAVKDLSGITGITNGIIIKAETRDAIEKRELQNAFRRNASLNGRKIEVDVSDTIIILRGTVVSGYQKTEAG